VPFLLPNFRVEEESRLIHLRNYWYRPPAAPLPGRKDGDFVSGLLRDGLPLYLRVKENLLEQIEGGKMQPGDRVASERELSEQFGISRMTVRHALTDLVTEGVLTRQQGRGTFVGRPKIRQALSGLTSFSEDMIARGLRPGGLVLSRHLTTAPRRVRAALDLGEEEQVVRLERLRLADDEPMALETTYLDGGRFGSLLDEELQNVSLYRWLESRYGVRVARATQSIEPAQADGGLARLLRVREGSLLLLLERVTFDEQDRPIEFVSSLYRADRYRFTVELQRR
jgi:GntR family transcriptional regulator